MKHVSIPTPSAAARRPDEPPLTPAAYLRLRRKVCGLSIDDLATRLAPRIADRPEASALIRMLETDGATARHDRTLRAIRRVLPFDPALYRQLQDEPAYRHPTVCRGCGHQGHTAASCRYLDTGADA